MNADELRFQDGIRNEWFTKNFNSNEVSINRIRLWRTFNLFWLWSTWTVYLCTLKSTELNVEKKIRMPKQKGLCWLRRFTWMVWMLPIMFASFFSQPHKISINLNLKFHFDDASFCQILWQKRMSIENNDVILVIIFKIWFDTRFCLPTFFMHCRLTVKGRQM